MALLPILTHPNERLHIVAKPVAEVDDRIRTLVADMAETMYAAKGIGLAATQVDVHERVVVIDLSEEHNQLLALINPTITKKDGETTFEEGCLSVPGIYDTVCVQHELDHLNGKLFVEYLSPLKQTRIKSKLKKRQRETL